MTGSILLEWDFLLHTIRLGMAITLVYDVLRILRMLIAHSSFFISLEDFFFWLGCTGVIFRLQFEQNNGISRGFSILGIMLGMFIYNRIAGRWLIRLAEKLTGLWKRGLTGLKKKITMILCKHKKNPGYLRSMYGKKKNSRSKKKAESSGHGAGIDGSDSYDDGSFLQ